MLTQSAKACKSLYLCRHNLPGVVPGAVPGAHSPGAKALAGSFAMSGFAGYSVPCKTLGKRPFAKDFCILPGLLPLAKCNISCSATPVKVIDSIHFRVLVVTSVKVIDSLFLPSNTYQFCSPISICSPFLHM